MRKEPAISNGMPLGMGISPSAGNTASSAKAPQPVKPITTSPKPTRTRVTPSPTAVTTPASSPPGVNGKAGLNWYLFWMMSASGKLTPAALTLTNTSRALGTGAAMSSTVSSSGPPCWLQRSAFMMWLPGQMNRIRWRCWPRCCYAAPPTQRRKPAAQRPRYQS